MCSIDHKYMLTNSREQFSSKPRGSAKNIGDLYYWKVLTKFSKSYLVDNLLLITKGRTLKKIRKWSFEKTDKTNSMIAFVIDNVFPYKTLLSIQVKLN